MPHSYLKVVGNLGYGYNIAAHAIAWEPLCYPCIQIENFLRFQVQDKHNASSFSRMSLKRVAPIRIQKYKKSVICHSTITDFILIYKLIPRFCLLACGLSFSINSSFFRLNQLTCETPSMWRLKFPSLSSFSEHIVLSALKCWLNSQE